MANTDKIIKNSREKLKKLVKSEITQMFETVLDYAQIACADPHVYKNLRAKILRSGNNCIRSINDRVDNYDVVYTAVGEDIIEIHRPTN